jgi:SAM-dependent methyltransferase
MESDRAPDRTAAPAPDVSVIVPFLNAARFLEETIESVRLQSYSSWELLLIDDGSTDESTDIARQYSLRHPGTIFYFEHPGHENRGPSAARNLGIRHARGRFIALLDADDVWLPNKLQEQVPLLEAHPSAGMLYGHSVFWSSWTGNAVDAGRDYVPPLGVPLDVISQSPETLTRCLQRTAAVPCPCSVLMWRDVVMQVGGFEESFRTILEDQAFFAKMLVAAPVYVADRIWDKYRIHPDSSCAKTERAGDLLDARLAYLDWLEQYLRDRGLASGEVWRALRTDRWRCRNPRLDRNLNRLGRRLGGLRARLRAALPDQLRIRIRRLAHPRGGVRFGNLRRLTPVSRHFGLDRGTPVDRYFIERFLARHADDVQGRVLEVGDDSYTRRFGGDRVTVRDVLHIHQGHPGATIVDDLASGVRMPSDAFDCIILTQTLQLIFDVHAAVGTLHRILKPGGILLATVPGISQLDAGEWQDTWFWSFTPAAVRRLFTERFPATELDVTSYGNVLAACAFLHGLAGEELSPGELDWSDPLYPVVVSLRARKPLADPRDSARAGVVKQDMQTHDE